MKPYAKLSRLGQLRRIRQLVETALEAYGMRGARLTFLRYFANITYRVDVQDLVTFGGVLDPYILNRYLLRVLLSNHWEYAMGEMTWLAVLSREAGLPVPAPIPTLDGELLTRVATPGVPEGRIVSFMSWVDGRKLTAGLLPNQYLDWGTMVARLHAFAADWQPPEGFKRYEWDWDGLLGGRGFGWSVEELVASMPEYLRAPFRAVSDEPREVMLALGKGSDVYGMVHGDMYPDNILFKGSQVYPIDFEDCGFGYWLWDIAVALSQQPWTKTWMWQSEAFLEGYAQVRTLPGSQLRYLDLFIAAQYATGILWASQFIQDEPTRQAEHEAWRDESGVMLLRYLDRR